MRTAEQRVREGRQRGAPGFRGQNETPAAARYAIPLGRPPHCRPTRHAEPSPPQGHCSRNRHSPRNHVWLGAGSNRETSAGYAWPTGSGAAGRAPLARRCTRSPATRHAAGNEAHPPWWQCRTRQAVNAPCLADNRSLRPPVDRGANRFRSPCTGDCDRSSRPHFLAAWVGPSAWAVVWCGDALHRRPSLSPPLHRLGDGDDGDRPAHPDPD